MLKRSVLAGLIIGFLVSLALLYPVSTALATRYIPDWQNPPPAVHRSLQIICLIAAASLGVLGVILSALWIKPSSYKAATKSGAIAGLFAHSIFHIMIFSPAEGMIRMRDILQLDPLSGPPTDAQLAEFIRRMNSVTFNNIMLPLFVGAGLGALVMSGLLALHNLLRYHNLNGDDSSPAPPTPPNLLHLLQQRRVIRWPDPEESTWRAGILSGVLLGAFFGLATLFGYNEGFDAQPIEPGLSEFLLGPGLRTAVSWTEELIPIVALFWGVLVLGLQRSPSSRFWSRVGACILAGVAAALTFQVIFLNHFWRLNMPMVHLYIFADATIVTPDELSIIPYIMAAAIFGAPLAGLLAVTLAGMLMAFLQGLFYAWLVPLVPGFRRPVDIGRRVYRKIRRNPTDTLPTVYELFRQEEEALEGIAHLSIRARSKKDLAVAQLGAAYHTALVHPETMDEAVETVLAVLQDHPDWRWRADIRELYRLLNAALTAREVADIAIIVPPSEERTSSLIGPLVRILDHLDAVIRTLKKYERVDELGGQILFLNNALDAIDHAQEYARQEIQSPSISRTVYPEQRALKQILDRWQTIVLNTIRSLRGRAELSATLETRRLPYRDTLNLELRVVNAGLNVAEDVWVQLAESVDYQPVPGQDKRGIEILLPGDGRSLEFSLQPTDFPTAPSEDTPTPVDAAANDDLRVVFDICYNDSVDPQRCLQLADSIAFLDQVHPFQRIFPIPYVTGTPLRTGDMFVGRGAILQFIRDRLLGTFQNNVIVLYGQRRTGKTSILYQLGRVLHDSHVCVLVDMQGKAARGLVDFLYSLADDITYALEDVDIEIALPEREAFQDAPEFFFRSRFLRQVTERLQELGLLLMFDEFEELQARVEAGKLDPTIFPYLRNLMQHEPKVDFIFAGTHKLEELSTEYWSILFNIATYKKISFLTEQEVTRLITEPVSSYGLRYDPLAIRRIHNVTAGQPYFVQLLCHELVAYHNETERNYLTTYDVETVLEKITERGEAHFKYIWSGATPQERWALLGTAEHLAHAETITFAELAAWLRQQDQDCLDSATLPDILAALEGRDILARTSRGSRRFRFKIDLVRRWIIANPQLRDTIGV